MANGNNGRLTDGSADFSSGVDSGRVTTIESVLTPHGLKRSQLAWANNVTMRGGGVGCRVGMQPLVQDAPWSGILQAAYIYEPRFDLPYIILRVGGRLYQVRVDTDNSVRDLSADFGLTQPPDAPLGHMAQGEEFLIDQVGDLITLPLFWDGAALRRSLGLPGQEIPSAGPMDYWMNRLFYAIERTYAGGDIVKGPSGTAPYGFRDSILKVTEMSLAANGDGITVPSNAGNIRCLTDTAELDTATGEGRLYIGTPKAVYRCNVPPTRADWVAVTQNNLPFQTVANKPRGFVSDRSTININSDIFYQTLQPSIDSLALSRRNFQQWGNTPVSRNINRLLAFNDRALLRYSSGIEFQNRMLQTAMPYASSVGVAHQAIATLDFDLISSLEEKLPPAWEGVSEQRDTDVMHFLKGDFGGLERAFSICRAKDSGKIEIWELTSASRTDNGDNRITWAVESPGYDFGNLLNLKQLESGEIWIDKIFGEIEVTVEFRPDAHPCWIFWHADKICAARKCEEDPGVLLPCYPEQPYCEQYRFPLTLPKPPERCITTNRVSVNIAHQFQVRVTVKGWARVRAVWIFGQPVAKRPFEGLRC